jgi:hypothetical protein
VARGTSVRSVLAPACAPGRLRRRCFACIEAPHTPENWYRIRNPAPLDATAVRRLLRCELCAISTTAALQALNSVLLLAASRYYPQSPQTT